jgi:hypothetical protein
MDSVPSSAPQSMNVLMKMFRDMPTELLDAQCELPTVWRQGKAIHVGGADRIVPSQRFYDVFQNGSPWPSACG